MTRIQLALQKVALLENVKPMRECPGKSYLAIAKRAGASQKFPTFFKRENLPLNLGLAGSSLGQRELLMNRVIEQVLRRA